MDELLHHCLRELSFDGDLGCKPSRLRDFIVDFYTHSPTAYPQNPDDAFCAFVWSLVVQQPTVRVGTIPPGVTSEVYIAPQTSAKRKAKAKGEEHVETMPPELNPVSDAKNRTLEDLKREHGDNLRISIDPEAVYAAITGSHIRFPKLSPMVYSALQIITRGRDNGVTVVSLGQQSKYDQKTCFYLVRQLTELDLVVKVRRGGVGTHFCIHKYFFDRSASWRSIRDEETRAEDSERRPDGKQAEVPEEDNGITADEPEPLDFTPIDARHLSSLPLIRARVVKLLKASKNQMHASNNMLLTLGFSNPTKTDRRFFQSRIREMLQMGLIEKVIVPSNRKKSINAMVKCFRLVTPEESPKRDEEEGVIVQVQEADDDDGSPLGEPNGVKMNLSIHKQILNLLEESGTMGMTLNELSIALCHFDKRTIELLLTRAEKFSPPSHLSDLGIAGLMETSGRERRHRYFTVASYRELVAKENLDKSTAGYADIDFANAGGFCPMNHDFFYREEATLAHYQDSFKDSEKAGKGRRHPPKNPVLADGSIKQGRPRKYPVNEDGDTIMANGKIRRKPKKRKREDTDSIRIAEDVQGSLSDEQKRPSKRRRGNSCDAEVIGEDEGVNMVDAEVQDTVTKGRSRPPKKQLKPGPEILKKRGRPRKTKPEGDEEIEVALPTPKKRGRSIESIQDVEDEGELVAPTPGRRGHPRKEIHTQATERPPRPKRPHIAPSSDILEIDGNDLAPCVLSPGPLDVLDNENTMNDLHPSSALLSDTSVPTVANDETFPPPSTSAVSQTYGTPRVSHSISAAYDIPIDPSLMDANEPVQSTPTNSLANALPYDPTTSSVTTLQPPTPLGISDSNAADVAMSITTPDSIHGNTQQTPESRMRVNVSHLRRENELYRVVEDFGGIVNIQTKEFYQAHSALLETLAQAGEPTSAPVGTRTDKRTVTATFNGLERRGRIKQLKTSVITHTGVSRPACIVHLPTIEQERLNAFLADLSRGLPPITPQHGTIVKIDERVEYGADHTPVPRGALPLQLLQMEQPGDDRKERWSKNAARADQLFSYDDTTIRDVLLTERTTLGQMYGFIVGKMIRSRELHLSTLDAFEKGNSSPYIVSRESRITDLSFFGQDLPLGLYCSLIASLTYDEDLNRFLSTEEGRQTLVRDLPSGLNSVLQIGRSRGRSRFLDILETLRSLRLVTPLQPCDTGTPWITCAENGDYPTAFEIASLDGWTISTPMAAPVYWHFSVTAPIHLWVVSEINPPLWQDVPVISCTDASTYWQLLQEACLNPALPIEPARHEIISEPLETVVSVARSLRRGASWNSEYVMTWHQTQYLRRFVDTSTGKTPLQNDDGGLSQIQKISWVSSIPEESIRMHYRKAHEKLEKVLERARPRKHGNKHAKATAETKASLAKKAAEARAQREKDWDLIVGRIHPVPLKGPASIRVRRVRNRFLQAGSTKDIRKWESEIADAVREADIAAKKVLKVTNKRMVPAKAAPALPGGPLTIVANPPEKSIDLLIAQQGPPLNESETLKRSRSRKKQETDSWEPKKPVRRHRFQWNRDYEELARDASAIIRARCRAGSRLDWGAFEQVFPAVPRNSVRQRLVHIRETPGNEAYLSRLEDKWYEIWMQHRGTPLLPDDDPTSTTNFDLIKHIEFLRGHIDKNALRVGFAQPKEKDGTTIPASYNQLLNEFDVIETVPMAPIWDFMWNVTVEEGREKRLLRQSFTKSCDELPHALDGPSESVLVAESALKMALGTPTERYDPESASALLHCVGEQRIGAATKNLLSRGILSKLVRDPQKQKPGRQLKISELNQNAIGGSINRDIYQDAAALEDISAQEDVWREWPLLATDGDSAALIQLVSDNKVEFRVDTSHAQLARPMLDWNSKKADDDQIETAIYVRFSDTQVRPSASLESSPVFTPAGLGTELSPGHGISSDGGPACCRTLSDDGLVDCVACLEDEWTTFKLSLGEAKRGLAMRVIAAARQAGDQGITKEALRKATLEISSEDLFQLVNRMTNTAIPLLSWTGYNSLVLISSLYLKNWTVIVSDNPMTRIFPRRWFDISGVKVADFWEAGLRAVMGAIVFRPGITQAELRWRLRSVYDRQEINDILRYLQEEGLIKLRCDPSEPPIGALDDVEEKYVFWFVGDSKHWYHV